MPASQTKPIPQSIPITPAAQIEDALGGAHRLDGEVVGVRRISGAWRWTAYETG